MMKKKFIVTKKTHIMKKNSYCDKKKTNKKTHIEKQGRIHGISRVSCFGERKAVYTKQKANWSQTDPPTDGRTDIATHRVA